VDPLVQSLTADRGDAGCRLDLVLVRRLASLRGATRTRLQRWIEDGRVELNGRVALRAAIRTNTGDTIRVTVPGDALRAASWEPAAADADGSTLDVLFEDEHLLAVNKPAGLVVHPAYKHPTGTLMNQLRSMPWRAGTRPSILGRLDKLTSGVVLAAKDRSLHAALQQTLLSISARKLYLAIVYGPVCPPRGTIDLPLGRDPRDRRRVVVVENGLPSATRFERLGRTAAHDGNLALLRCRLMTGRMHQVRVHLAARGWPIVGDPVYGDRAYVGPSFSSGDRLHPTLRSGLPTSLARQALHAQRVRFIHPITRATIRIDAPVPDDMQSIIDHCGWGEAAQRFEEDE